MNGEEDPHYLHGRTGLAVAVRPPVKMPTALCWTDDGWLVIGTQHGRVLMTHPAMGTRLLAQLEAPPAGLGTNEGRIYIFERDGTWQEVDKQGELVARGTHPFVDSVQVRFHERRVIVTGPTARDRQTLFYEDGEKVFRVRLPPRAVAFVDARARVGLAQATTEGLEVVRMQPGSRFSSTPLLPHDLSVVGAYVIGVTGRGCCVWTIDTGESTQVEMDGTTAGALTLDGRWLALGTWKGSVALVDLHDPASVVQPVLVEASEQPVTTISFASNGQWMSSGADDLILWTWS